MIEAAKIGSYARREQEWSFQSNLAAGEITQIFKQIRAAQIREAIAEREWKNHQQEIKNAREIEMFLTNEKKGKRTNREFYTWMKREVRALYGRCFEFGFDIARKAERALQHELGNPDLTFLDFGYLSGKEGLLAGEKLYFDVKRMEMAYVELNQREYELTRSVSLLQLDPEALLRLRETGTCTFDVPEDVFDLGCPGHYFRRLKAVALTIPCVVGPYASVNCTLTLTKSSIRKSPLLADGAYLPSDGEDERFESYLGSVQSVVTSSGQNDAGLFEVNLRDERNLPFEYAGAISTWQLDLPRTLRQFDYETIADVVLHLRYTAREGGSQLRAAAEASLLERMKDAEAAGCVRLLSLQYEFPTAWAKFKSTKLSGDVKTAELSIVLGEQHYPFWARGRLGTVKRAVLFAKTAAPTLDVFKTAAGGDADKDTLAADPSLGLSFGKLVKTAPASPIGNVTLHLSDNQIQDLWLAVEWGS